MGNVKLRPWCTDQVPVVPLVTYSNDGGDPSDVLGSEIFAQSDFFGSMEDAGIFGGSEKNRFWVVKKGLRDILGYAKNFLG